MFDASFGTRRRAVNELGALFKMIHNVTANQVFDFIVLVVPGFIAYRVGERINGRDRTRVSDHIIDIVIYSLLCDVVMLGLVAMVSFIGNVAVRTALIVVTVLAAGGALPFGLAIGWSRFCNRLVRRGSIPDLTAKPWDHVFRRIAEEQKNIGVVVTLRDGRRVGARLLDPGYTSSYPAAEQVMLGQTWRVSERGEFIAPIDGSWGLLVDKADCETIEFIEWDVIERYLLNQNDGKVKS